MSGVVESLRSMLDLVPHVGPTGVLEIAILSWMVYMFLNWVRDTKAWVLLRGVLLILAFVFFCMVFNLNTILWILGRVATIAVTAIIIIFQPELRRALEQLGSRNIVRSLGRVLLKPDSDEERMSEKTVSQLVSASFTLGQAKTGALMVLEQENSLKDIVRTGIDIDGIVTRQLLINIFEKNTPLHDGAVIIRGNRVVSATAYLPLSDNMKISKDLGTRHRAAIGISEVTDSLTIVVSEETGHVSVARNGDLSVVKEPEELKNLLMELVREPEQQSPFGFLKGKSKNEG